MYFYLLLLKLFKDGDFLLLFIFGIILDFGSLKMNLEILFISDLFEFLGKVLVKYYFWVWYVFYLLCYGIIGIYVVYIRLVMVIIFVFLGLFVYG